MLKLRCLYHHVIVRVDKPKNDDKSLIIIPESVLDEQARHTGVIEYVGHGRVNKDGEIEPLIVKPGDRVLFGKYAGLQLIINGVEYKHMREDEIIAIIEESEDNLKIEDPEY